MADFLIIGAGVIGLSLALEAKRRYPHASVVVLEKEQGLGRHASGRNSGVLHAGFYYTADSLKARFSVDGNRRLTSYCEERNIPINRCGKLVVARKPSELRDLDELERRGRVNGVELEMLGADVAREIEPRVRTHERALWSPNTASVDPAAVMMALAADAEREGIKIWTGISFRDTPRSGQVITDQGLISAGYVINAAGLYADRVARRYGFSERYRILPFKGLYLYSGERQGGIRTNIYPVPDLASPFLGVHFTVAADGRSKIGPTAIPALWREHYRGFENFKASELLDVLWREAGLFFRDDFRFRQFALREVRKYHRPTLVRLAAQLVKGVREEDWSRWGRPGIRAQLLNRVTRRLEMDFVVEGDDRSFHVLNAVSPAFTCAFPFAEFCWNEIESRV